MADVGVSYELAGSSTVTFNDGSADQFYITEITGLGGPPVRAPIDDMPYGDGGLVHTFWKGPRHLIVDGIFLITSTWKMDDIVVIRNDFEEDLRVCLESIITADGTLTWQPQGQLERSLVVRHDVQLEYVHDQDYRVVAFHFGLVAADPDWMEAI